MLLPQSKFIHMYFLENYILKSAEVQYLLRILNIVKMKMKRKSYKQSRYPIDNPEPNTTPSACVK